MKAAEEALLVDPDDSGPSRRGAVATWIQRARKEGWLDGRKPGPRLIEWLEEQQDNDDQIKTS